MNEFNDNEPEITETSTCMKNERTAQEFWVMIEKEAAEFEVTVDYYLEECIVFR